MTSLPEKQLNDLKGFVNLLKAKPQILHQPDLKFFKDYLASLGANIPAQVEPEPKPREPEPEPKPKQTEPQPKPKEPEPEPEHEPEPEPEQEPDHELWETLDNEVLDFGDPKKIVTEEDEDEASNFMAQGRKAFREKNYEVAVQAYTKAVQYNPTSSVLFASRGECYLALKKPCAAEKDGDMALHFNPDSSKGYRVRGTARRYLGKYEEGISDLYQANKADWEENTELLIKSIKDRVTKIQEAKRLQEKRQKEKDLEERRHRAAEARRQAQEEEDRRRREEADGEGSFPGMPPGMMDAFNDPDVKAALEDPTIMSKLQECLTDPSKLDVYAKEVPAIKKIAQKLGPFLSMMRGAGAGPGAGGGGGRPAGGAQAHSQHQHSVPEDDLD